MRLNSCKERQDGPYVGGERGCCEVTWVRYVVRRGSVSVELLCQH